MNGYASIQSTFFDPIHIGVTTTKESTTEYKQDLTFKHKNYRTTISNYITPQSLTIHSKYCTDIKDIYKLHLKNKLFNEDISEFEIQLDTYNFQRFDQIFNTSILSQLTTNPPLLISRNFSTTTTAQDLYNSNIQCSYEIADMLSYEIQNQIENTVVLNIGKKIKDDNTVNICQKITDLDTIEDTIKTNFNSDIIGYYIENYSLPEVRLFLKKLQTYSQSTHIILVVKSSFIEPEEFDMFKDLNITFIYSNTDRFGTPFKYKDYFDYNIIKKDRVTPSFYNTSIFSMLQKKYRKFKKNLPQIPDEYPTTINTRKKSYIPFKTHLYKTEETNQGYFNKTITNPCHTSKKDGFVTLEYKMHQDYIEDIKTENLHTLYSLPD